MPQPAGGRASDQHADWLQARSAVFAVSDDREEHPPEDWHLVLAEAVHRRCLSAVADAGHLRAQGVPCLGDFRDSRAAIARVAAAHDEAGPFEPSARCSLRISAHSSTMSTLSPPGSPLEPEDSPERVTFQPPLKGQFSTVADTPNAGRCNGDDERDEWRATQTHQGSTPDWTK
jgi:hypothetical protein